jgi:hypothetical protein
MLRDNRFIQLSIFVGRREGLEEMCDVIEAENIEIKLE